MYVLYAKDMIKKGIEMLNWAIDVVRRFVAFTGIGSEKRRLRYEIALLKERNKALVEANRKLRDEMLGTTVFIRHMNEVYAELLIQQGVTQEDIASKFSFDN